MKDGMIEKRRQQFLAVLLACLLALQSFTPLTALAASYSGTYSWEGLTGNVVGALLVSGDTIMLTGASNIMYIQGDFKLDDAALDGDYGAYVAKYELNGTAHTVIGVSQTDPNRSKFVGWKYSSYFGSGDAAVFTPVSTDDCTKIIIGDNNGEGGTIQGMFMNYSPVPEIDSLPHRTGYLFAGYYVGDQQVIDASGKWQAVLVKDGSGDDLWEIYSEGEGDNLCYYFRKNNVQADLSSIDFVAHWTPIEYSVEFEPNGPTDSMNPMTGLKYDAEYSISANTLTKNYYDFDGWKVQGTDTIYEDQATIKNLTTVNNATVKLQAQWKKKDYTITLDPAGGSFSDTTFAEVGTTGTYQRKYQVDDASFTLPAPTKTECQFLGWKLGDADPISNVTINTSAPENRTYTAIWKTNQYSVTFKDENGNVLKAAKLYDYNTPAASIEKPADPTKTSTPENTYTFDKWTPEITDVTGDATYTATYTATKNKYNVIWKDEDGKVLQTKEYEYGTLPADIEKPANNPTKDRTDEYTYTFNGWTPEIAQVTGEATYTATYKEEKNKYKVTWVNEGQTIAEKLYDYGTVSGNIVKPDNPTKTSTPEYTYTFAGWSPAIANVTKDATYTATYTAQKNKYTVTWKDADGTVLISNELEYGTPVNKLGKPADPSKEATPEYTYTFKGWDKEPAMVTGDATYTATYTETKNKYNVIWKDEDGKVLQTKEYEYGTLPADIEKPANNPTKDRTDEYTYTFNGWTPEIAQVTGEATYTATYKEEKNKYKVTWVNEGQTIAEKLYDYGTVSGNIVKPDNPTKTSTPEYTYTFAGWSPAIANVTKDATYTATYTAQKNKYTVTWKDADGTVLISNELEYGTPVNKLGKPADPSKEATPEYTYTFKGWDKEPAMVTGDATYTAAYTATKNKYDITWKDENDNIIRTDSVEYGTAAGSLSQPKAPEKEPTVEYAYTFTGWTPAITDVTADATYKATYKQENRKYSIKWIDGNGKTIKDDAVEYGTVSGNLVVPENPAKDATAEYSYTFTGWEPALADVTKDAEYTAVFTQEKNKYEVKWVDGDGKTLKTETLEYGAVPEYDGQTPTKSADADYEYTFDGKWSPQVGKVTGNTTYTATFAQKAVNKSGATNDQDTGKDTEQKGEDPFLDTDDKEADVKGTEFGVLFPGCGKVTATSIELKWKKVDKADAYYIYGSMCNHANRKYTYKRLATITDKNQTRWTAKKLKKKSYYKFYIVAVRYVNGEEVLVSKSKRLHITTLNPTYGDATGLKVTAPKKVKVRKGNKYLKTEVLKDGYTIILKHGQTIKIKAKEYNKDKKIKHHKTIGFESSKPSVAVLSQIKRTENYRYMKIRGGKRGKCKLYIYAQNGKYITLNIVVR